MTIQQHASTETSDHAPLGGPKSLHIKVFDNAKGGTLATNVNVPIGLVKWGIKMAQRFSPEMREVDLDWDSINQMLSEGARGEIVHVDDEEQQKTIEVWVE